MNITDLDSLNIRLCYSTFNMRSSSPKRSILIINPNSTQSMTEALVPLVKELGFNDVGYTYLCITATKRV
jgi:hypothetical protein